MTCGPTYGDWDSASRFISRHSPNAGSVAGQLVQDSPAQAHTRQGMWFNRRPEWQPRSRVGSGPAYRFLALPFFQNGLATTSAGIRSPRHSTSNLVPTFAAAAGR
jgi:hypothetical protein